MKLLAVLVFIGFLNLYGQADCNDKEFHYSFCLKEVSFGGTNGNYIYIMHDDYSEHYTPPHFVKTFVVQATS